MTNEQTVLNVALLEELTGEVKRLPARVTHLEAQLEQWGRYLAGPTKDDMAWADKRLDELIDELNEAAPDFPEGTAQEAIAATFDDNFPGEGCA